MLAIVKERDGRNNRPHRVSDEHVGQTISAVQLIARIYGSELTAEGQIPPRVGHLLQVELVPSNLGSHFNHVFPVDKADRIV